MPEPAIVFVGFMGAGKSTALAAAARAGLATAETDALLEAELGCTIPEAFERHGEAGFREREAELVGSLLARADGGAIALGGGSVLSARVRAALDRHVVVWLEVDAEGAWRRIAHSDRPLARDREGVEELLSARLPLYEAVADAVIPHGDREVVARALPAIQALARLPAGTKLCWASSASGEYPVYVGRELLAAAFGGDGAVAVQGRRFCVSDTDVAALYADRLRPLEATVTVPPGEGAKTLGEAERVLEALAAAGMTRGDHLLALGGGVVGDLGGFCAHVYQRGVPVVQVPTTVVAQVDSAYGGKTGVDLAGLKNYAGAYHQPAAVLADTATLASLPRRELAAGYVEALKTGLLAGGALWERVRAVQALDPASLDDVVFACARFKCGVVAADERDGGLRQILNLGHTVGHGIEGASGFGRYLHGEAIGLGLLAALRLSGAERLRAECLEILRRHGLPVELDPEIGVDAVLAALQHDKKRTAEGVPFVLLSEPGEPRPGQVLAADRVAAAVAELHPPGASA